ncbi:MAG: hypothetical protein ACREXW_18605 [Gammaproteobacteria bacterium]
MSQANKAVSGEQMRPEYDIRGGVRGKYYERYRQGTNVVVLEPDVAAVFQGAEAVNRALRMLIQVARKQVEEATSSTGAASN